MEHKIVELSANPSNPSDRSDSSANETDIVAEPIPVYSPFEADAIRLPTHSEDGTDLTLIRWMLSLTPLERLRTAQQYARSVQRLRDAASRARH